MKKLFIALLLIVLLIPTMAMAAKSPTVFDKVKCDPPIFFEFLENEPPALEIEGYTIVEVLDMTMTKEYELVEWTLMTTFKLDADIMVVLKPIEGEPFFIPAEVNKKGNIVTNLKGVEPDTYLIYFLLGDA